MFKEVKVIDTSFTVEDLSIFESLEKLTIIKVNEKKDNDIIVIKNLQNLKSIHFVSISDFTIENCPNIESIYVSKCSNKKELILPKLPKLQYFNYNQSPIKLISGFEHCPILNHIIIHDTCLDNIDLTNLSQLVHLAIQYSSLKSISSLEHCNLLKYLYLNNNQLSELPNIDQCGELYLLNISFNLFESLLIYGCTKLEKIYIRHNPLKQINSLFTSNLKLLDSDLDVLPHLMLNTIDQ